MKYLTLTLLLGTFLFSSCGWTDNQRKAARKSIGDGFSEGLEASGESVDPKTKEAWLDCVMDKVTERWTFDELTEVPEGLDELQNKCAQEVGLYDAISIQ